MIRVLIIDPAGNLRGSERALLDLLDEMPSQVAVCCPPKTPLVAELGLRGRRTFPLFVAALHLKPRWRRLQAALGVLGACLAFRPKVLHLNQAGAFKVALPAARFLGLPIVAHVRLFEDVAYLAKQRYRPHSIIAVSDAVESEIRKFRNLDCVPVNRIYDGYRRHNKQDLGVAGRDSGRIAVVGQIVHGKGQDLLVEALSLLKHAPISCVVAGEGELLQGLRTRADELRLTSITWCGFVPDVNGLLRNCAVLCLPSWHETLGRVIFEAWDAGAVPVVFAGSGGAAEVVRAADAGIVYAEQSAQCLADALRRAFELSEEEKFRLVENGRTWLQANCAPEPYGRAVAAVLSRS